MKKIEDFLIKLPGIKKFVNYLHQTQDELDYFKSRSEVSDELYDSFQSARVTEEYQSVYTKQNPLVSICIPTYNRAEILVGRSVHSALNQSYKNIQVLVVGDGCTDDTEHRMSEISDERLTFVNLPERGNYPEDAELRWMVAGTPPVNKCLNMAKGDFVTHLDDDDEYLPNRIAELVKFIQSTRADIVWHPFHRELPSGKWQTVNPRGFFRNQVTNSAIFYHNWLKCIAFDINAYKLREPGDWNRFRKFKYLGAKTSLYKDILMKHHKERNQVTLFGEQSSV